MYACVSPDQEIPASYTPGETTNTIATVCSSVRDRPRTVKRVAREYRFLSDRASNVCRQALEELRRIGYNAYFGLVGWNYDRQLVTRYNRTPAGELRSYELLNRHGNDRMLGEIDKWCDDDTVIYDIGANVGIYALGLTVERPHRRVFAFEPNPTTAKQLQANAKLNELDDRISVAHVGLGVEDGTRQFYRSTFPELSGFDEASASRWGARVREAIAVDVRTLDSVVATLPSPDVIKIDVEGHALAVLRGGVKTLQYAEPVLFIEIHTDTVEEGGTLRELLEDIGYEISERDSYWRCEPVTRSRTPS